MNARGIISASLIFLVTLGFCLWIRLSPAYLDLTTILERAGIIAAILGGILLTAAAVDHRKAH